MSKVALGFGGMERSGKNNLGRVVLDEHEVRYLRSVIAAALASEPMPHNARALYAIADALQAADACPIESADRLRAYHSGLRKAAR